MGKTAIVKIMERAAGREVKVGERVWCNVDLASARDFGGANVVLQFEKEMGKDAHAGTSAPINATVKAAPKGKLPSTVKSGKSHIL